jgi:hypothetical protein
VQRRHQRAELVSGAGVLLALRARGGELVAQRGGIGLGRRERL